MDRRRNRNKFSSTSSRDPCTTSVVVETRKYVLYYILFHRCNIFERSEVCGFFFFKLNRLTERLLGCVLSAGTIRGNKSYDSKKTFFTFGDLEGELVYPCEVSPGPGRTLCNNIFVWQMMTMRLPGSVINQIISESRKLSIKVVCDDFFCCYFIFEYKDAFLLFVIKCECVVSVNKVSYDTTL
jgi:hypothetical protein